MEPVFPRRRALAARAVAPLALTVALLSTGGTAFAHGGRFIAPPPPAPPTAPPPPFIPRLPHPAPPTSPAPTPPPPSPSTTPSTPNAPPTTPTTPNGPPHSPDATGPDVGAPTSRLQRPGRAKGTGLDGGWRDWWEANADALRGGRGVDLRVTTDGGLFRVGGSESGNKGDAARPTRRAVERDVLPLLRWAADRVNRQDPDTVAAALLAMGKTARGADDVAILCEALGRKNVPEVEREAAALALGLLRRTDPADAFDGKALDAVRQRLFLAMDDPSMPGRTRCFAALAVGLLGDQAFDPADAFARDGRLATRELWMRLEAEHAADEVPVALLTALSLQPRAGVPEAILDGLRGLCATGRLAGRTRGQLTRAHAALALARLGASDASGLFLGVAKSRNFDVPTRRSAIVALSILAPRLDGDRRAAAASGLADISRAGDPDTAGLALMSIARLLAADAAAGSSVAFEKGDGDETLLRAMNGGASEVRSFAALGLGVAGRPEGKAADCEAFVAFREKALAVLRSAGADEGGDPDGRGACCIALGLLEDERAVPALIGIASRRGNGVLLRADACAALGLLGRPTPETLAMLRGALTERRSDELRRESARALGLLGDVSAVPALVVELQSGASDHVLARVALALGSIGSVSAIGPLIELAKNKSATDEMRAIAVASLGLIGDPEAIPSLSRIGADSNYLARTDALHEAMSLL